MLTETCCVWYLINLNSSATDNNGTADITHSYGAAGDIPVVGDWNGDGKSEIGYHRRSTNYWYLDFVGDGAWHGMAAA